MSTFFSAVGVLGLLSVVWIGLRYRAWKHREAQRSDVSPEWLVQNSYGKDGDEPPWK